MPDRLKYIFKYIFTRQNLIVISACLAFLIYKLSNLAWRFGDGNAYLYMVDQFLHGHWPYRDFFLADPPFFVLFLSLVRTIFGTHWLWYQTIPVILQIINAVLLWRLLKPTNHLAFLAPVLYLFSFTVLATSDFSTGVQLVVLFALLGDFLYQARHPFWSGVFWSLAALTKLYALPALLGWLLYLILAKKFSWHFIWGLAASGTIVMLPFLLMSPRGLIDSIILHQLHRTSGLNSWAVWRFFLSHEWAFWLAGLAGVFYKSGREYFWPLAFSVIFFLFFRDLYYLYLSFLFPYLVLLSVGFAARAVQSPEVRPLALVALLALVVNLLFGFYQYQTTVLLSGRFLNVQEIGSFLQAQTAHSQIYGSHELAPAVALLSGKKLFGNYIDTNAQVFSAGTLDLETVSRQAATEGIYLLARISDYPEYGINQTGFEGYFSRAVFVEFCQPLKLFPSTSNETDNYIGIYDCRPRLLPETSAD
ncbi:MAG: hypothetical protein A2760_01195 [Candidatus Doudnabacteria bacterium RIFCSPHIGHO2_01_FULL_50_67]|uniref:Glycosyltransferase RgtA/B/C/D-like domain-containing protein n=1 Tax=Candidatus Doudnabacteria bacterium RIFCSPHIGHO2_12_FULL_48_16 TaxID=1817838 RepID=A0A1F5PL51_9BACT|nr:MAG: hypothetical protein A3B77_00840 [Candidatus Doudnabacteria bacterium RIFCSPHIGHO2_02_FULL_49_24]OGE88793.1 MAG: hypothetical protein A2760_01195 [Candidatus Doudnabacteria bacterium RIFCSPHIGHO2_01_FULL_50_67]OGE90685.1 MAG: hypothetical protein A3E29_00970 [Candidatus Doudnabacteria bacterium RIFCSPHIGHO2_12_FULL_48_16]OGE97016.1 MAG: hypothetical protein A2990_02995 [Candidatus Doudnabacteria bacterium RIFCSPLOWO2_01_FULL_49_40]OGF02904.1 MAG: hypothetical protein A3H14_00980 [Candid